MRINPYNLNSQLIENNYYTNKLKFLDISKNSAIYTIKKLNILVKVYKLTTKEYDKTLTTANLYNLKLYEYNKIGNCNPYRELFILIKLTNLFYTNICPHTTILITYHHFENKCTKCNSLISENINTINNVSNDIINYLNLKLVSNHELFIYKEYIEYELKNFLFKKNSNEFMYILLFQLLYTLYINNTKLNLINYDLHLNNIFIKKIKPGGYWTYVIKNVNYYIPNIGYIFIIGDYSNCLTDQFILTKEEKQIYKWFKLIHFDVYSLLQNFTYHNLRKYYIHWNYRNTFVNKVKHSFTDIYNETLNDINSIIIKNKNKKYSINKFLYSKLLTKITSDKELFYSLYPKYKYFKLNSSFKKIIKKYLHKDLYIYSMKTNPKLSPLNIISNEFDFFKKKPKNSYLLKKYSI